MENSTKAERKNYCDNVTGGSQRLSEAKPMAPTERRNVCKKFEKIFNNSENISKHLPTKNSLITGNNPPVPKARASEACLYTK